MDDEIAQKFINSVVKNLQVLCHSNVDFNKNVEVIGHLYLNVDSCTKLNYIVNEKVCKNEASSTVFVSNSFHAEVGLKKKEKEPVNKSVDEVAQRLQRSHHSHHSHPRDDYSRRHSIDSNSTSQKREREHHGHSFHMEPKIPRLSDPMESRQSSSIHSPNSRNKHSHENSASSTLHKQQILEVDLAKVKKEFISGGGCGMEGGNNEESSTCRSNTGPFLNEPDVPSVDFSTAFPISIHQNQNLAAALNIPEISGSSNSNNNTSAASSIDQKPFAHNSSIEPPQFPPMMAGGSPRLRPPWMGEHSVNPSAASSNFPDMFRFAKRSRTVFSQFQLQTLEEVFQISPYLSALQKRELSRALDMSMETLSKWFQNRRQRPKKSDPDLEKFKKPETGQSAGPSLDCGSVSQSDEHASEQESNIESDNSVDHKTDTHNTSMHYNSDDSNESIPEKIL